MELTNNYLKELFRQEVKKTKGMIVTDIIPSPKDFVPRIQALAAGMEHDGLLDLYTLTHAMYHQKTQKKLLSEHLFYLLSIYRNEILQRMSRYSQQTNRP